MLLAEIKGQPKLYKSIWYKAFIKLVNFIMRIGYNNAADSYNRANEEMLSTFTAANRTDGEM